MAQAEEVYLIQVYNAHAGCMEIRPIAYHVSPMVGETRISRHAESPPENGAHEKGHLILDRVASTFSLTSLLLLHG